MLNGRRIVTAALALPLLWATTLGSPAVAAPAEEPPSDLSVNFNRLNPSTKWTLTRKLHLNFPTFHPQGIAFTQDRIFLSAVEVLEPTRQYLIPRGGYDRSPGKGVGHLFVMDRDGNLQQDIHLGEGDMYHPGGIDFDGTDVWVPVSQYRPNSSTLIYRVNATSLDVQRQFEVKDHFGGIIKDRSTGRLVANTWASRRFVEWDLQGNQTRAWPNLNLLIDYQDCQYVPNGQMLCGGIAGLSQILASGTGIPLFELGGMAMMDLRSTLVTRAIPFQQRSSAGHVATRNPFKMSAQGGHLTLNVAPDDGDEGTGTEILTYEADVTPAESNQR